MILAHHSIFGFYGFWLPNDPRGSGSDYIAVWELYRYGPATKVTNRRSVAHRPVDPAWKSAAVAAIAHRPLIVTGVEALAAVAGFRDAISEAGYAIHACAVLPDHVHLVIGRNKRDIRQIVGHLKSRGTRRLRATLADDRPIWGEHGWNVALNSKQAVERAIAYVEENPLKEGKRRQRWEFVTEFDEDAARSVDFQGTKRRLGGAARESHLAKVAREARRKRRR